MMLQRSLVRADCPTAINSHCDACLLEVVVDFDDDVVLM